MASRQEAIEKIRNYQATKSQPNIVNSDSVATAVAPTAKGIYPVKYNDVSEVTPQDSSFAQMLLDSRANSRPLTQLIDPSQMIAGKSLSFNKYVMDFINDTGYYGHSNPYTDQQLLMAYMSSVYLFAALRRVANLVSRIQIVAEVQQGSKYVRAGESELINKIFRKDGPTVFSRAYLNYAIYGTAVIYKTKTLKAILDSARGDPIYDYKDNAVGGLHVLDKPFWALDKDTFDGEIKGLYVQRGVKHVSNRNYLDRREFVHFTDWNPEDPTEGRSIATVAIHEAMTNAAIARWSAEYFTRGAMPFVLVAMEEDPAMISDTDLMKYKRQFEDHWQGVNSSLRSVFIDRKVEVQQVGIPASEVAASDLNTTALEGISAAVGIDRELIVTPEGGSQERHAVLVKRAWDDTVLPLANALLSAFARDLGLPDGMQLVLELSHIPELDADRADRVSTELSVYNDGAQTFNEMRTRLNMPTIPYFDGLIKTDDGLVPIEKIAEAAKIPPRRIMEAYDAWYDKGLSSFNDYRQAIGKKPVQGMEDVLIVDGRPMKLAKLLQMLHLPTDSDIQREAEFLDKSLRTFNDMRKALNLDIVDGLDDVIQVDGRPVKLKEFIHHAQTPLEGRVSFNKDMLDAGLQSFNDMRRELGLKEIQAFDDVFMFDGQPIKLENLIKAINGPSESDVSSETQLLDSTLKDFNSVREALSLPAIQGMEDVFFLDGRPVRYSAILKLLDMPSERQVDIDMQLFEKGIQSVNDFLVSMGKDPIPQFDGWYNVDGQLTTLDRIIRQDKFLDEKIIERVTDLWSDNLLKRSRTMSFLDLEMGPDEFDGYLVEFEAEMELRRERKMKELEEELEGKRAQREQDMEISKMQRQGEIEVARSKIDMEIELEKMRREQEIELEFEEKRMFMEARVEMQIEKMKSAENADKSVDDDDDAFRSFDDDDPDDPNNPDGSPPSGGNGGNSKPFRPDGFIQKDGDLNMVEVLSNPYEGNLVSKLADDQVVEIMGRNDDGQWLQIFTPEGGLGWIESDSLITDRDIESLPIINSENIEFVTGIPEKSDTVSENYDGTKSEDRYMQDDSDSEISLPPIMRSPDELGISEDEAFDMAQELLDEVNYRDRMGIDVPDPDNTFDIKSIQGATTKNVAYASVWLGNNDIITAIQDEVREKMGYHPDIEWVDPDKFHITLLYCYDIDADALENVRKLLPSQVDHMDIHIGPLDIFDNEYEKVIYLTVQPNVDLERLQQRFNVSFSAYGTPISEYSNPAEYKPHITLAFIPPDIQPIEYKNEYVVSPEFVTVGRDEYEEVFSIPMISLDHVLNGHDEPDGTMMLLTTIQSEEDNSTLNKYYRSAWVKYVNVWKKTGVINENLPDRIVKSVNEYSSALKVISESVFDVTIKAIKDGMFDEDKDYDKNPLSSYLNKSWQTSPMEELKAWERKTIKGYRSDQGVRKGISFESKLTPKHISVFIRKSLRSIETEDDIKEIFSTAREQMEG